MYHPHTKARKLLLCKKPKSIVSKLLFTTYGIDTISFRGPENWQDLRQDLKNSDSLNLFESHIKRHGWNLNLPLQDM